MRVLLAYIIRKTITVQVNGDYPMYESPYKVMIARMLHFLPDKNKLLLEKGAQTAQMYTAEDEMDNRTVYNILDKICKGH